VRIVNPANPTTAHISETRAYELCCADLASWVGEHEIRLKTKREIAAEAAEAYDPIVKRGRIASRRAIRKLPVVGDLNKLITLRGARYTGAKT
jgi:hypothetical protein